jgi:protein-disulfide isomerase
MASLKDPVTEKDHIQGSDDAMITLVEYGDYECPHCGMAHPIVKKLQKHFGERLRFVFRNFPLTEIHPLAEPAAEAAEFANDSGKFWEMHDLIFENQPSLSIPFLRGLADTLELSTEDLEVAIANRTYAPKIKKDFMGGVRSGVNGTPTFFINDQRFNGPPTYEELLLAIETIYV